MVSSNLTAGSCVTPVVGLSQRVAIRARFHAVDGLPDDVSPRGMRL